METFERFESEVRSYCRAFPTVFARARGAHVWDENDRRYIDFFAGAGALNYGHNPRPMKERLLAYIEDDGIAHSLDMATAAKARLIETFRATVLEPRGLDYKIMFPGPTGTNAVESALKLARKVTGRQSVIGFTNAFHGMTLGALAVSGNQFKRDGAGVQLDNTVHMPYENYLGGEIDTLAYFERFLDDAGSGVALPAAVILETVQGEGGLHSASAEWLQGVEALCRRWDILLIVDDIQVGCGRTGPFFSFERAGIRPDIVCLSKSISGYGIPLALTLIKPEYDVWEPGEHNGTFRGHNLAFVTATEALSYWRDDSLTRAVDAKARRVRHTLDEIVERHPAAQGEVRGRGLIQGLACGVDGLARAICQEAFDRGLLMETSGPNDEVVKILPPLTIGDEALEGGLRIVAESMAAALPQALKTAVAS